VTDLIERMAQERARSCSRPTMQTFSPIPVRSRTWLPYAALIQRATPSWEWSHIDGGHLTHGGKVSLTSKFFKSVSYAVNPETGRIDYDQVADLAKSTGRRLSSRVRPPILVRLISKSSARLPRTSAPITSATSPTSRVWSLRASIRGPVPYGDIVSTTTHKTLRGPRGGMLLCRAEHAAAVDRAVLPGPPGRAAHAHDHCCSRGAGRGEHARIHRLRETNRQERQGPGEKLMEYGFKLMSDGTDNHLMLIDLRNKNIRARNSQGLDRLA